MNRTLGVYLLANSVRCVERSAFSANPRGMHETQFDPERPALAVAALRERFGAVSRIALTVGLGFLHVKQVKLPPAPAAERRRILALEPDRFFAVQGERLAVALDTNENVAYAVNADLLSQWIAAFEQWAPVDLVEPAPQSLARALGPASNGTFVVQAGAGEHGIVELQNRRVRTVRRMLGDAPRSAQPIPARDGATADYVIALGAARGLRTAVDAMLLPDEVALRIGQRRRSRAVANAAIAAVAAGLALWALDWSRERKLERINAEIAALTSQAQDALALRERLAVVDREAAAIRDLALRRLDPLPVLQALSQRLPAGAVVLSISASNGEWQIEGTAPDAAAIVPRLDQDDRFQDLRILSASSRFSEGTRTLETFSIAFRVRPID